MIHGHSLKFIVGLTLILTNQFIGWGGVILCGYFARSCGKKAYYGMGTLFYALSWVMLGLGIMLAGPEGVALFRKAAAGHRWQTLAAAGILLLGLCVYAWNKRKKKALFTATDKA